MSHDLELSSETVSSPPQVMIFLERHGKTFRPATKPDDYKELSQAGRLSQEGQQESQTVAKDMAHKILESGRPVTFFFLGSPSEYFIDGQAFGARGQHTAQVSAQAVQEVIDEMGLPPERANIHYFGKDDHGSRPHQKLSEPDYFYVNGSDHPTAYFEALVDKFGKEGREEGWLNHPEELKEARHEAGAQSAPEVSARVMKLIRAIEKYAEVFSKEHPYRDMVFFMATHGDVMRAVIQHGFNSNEQAKEYNFGNNEILEIKVAPGQVATSFRGKFYETNI